MKNKLLLCMCMWLPILGYAQILQDSTVQVIAYWRLGDSYKYEYINNEYTVEGNDTIWGDSSREIFAIEVTDSTESNYVLKYTTLESTHDSKDKEFEAIMKPLMDKYQSIPMYFSTNAYGSFQDIARWDELQLVLDSMTTDIRNNLDKVYFPNEKKENIPEENLQQFYQILDHVLQSYKNKEMTIQGMDFLIDPLYYHGTRMEQGKEYIGKQKFASPWIPTETIDADVILKIDKVDYENNWVTFHRTQQYEASQLLDSFFRYMQQVLPPEAREQLTPEQLPFVMVETFFNLDVHVNTGWPGFAYYEKVTQVGPKKIVKAWSLDLVIDE